MKKIVLLLWRKNMSLWGYVEMPKQYTSAGKCYKVAISFCWVCMYFLHNIFAIFQFTFRAVNEVFIPPTFIFFSNPCWSISFIECDVFIFWDFAWLRLNFVDWPFTFFENLKKRNDLDDRNCYSVKKEGHKGVIPVLIVHS